MYRVTLVTFPGVYSDDAETIVNDFVNLYDATEFYENALESGEIDTGEINTI